MKKLLLLMTVCFVMVACGGEQKKKSANTLSPEKTEAVFYWWKTETFYDDHLPRVKMAGLDPDRMYRVHELNRIDNVPLPYEGLAFRRST